MPNLLDDDFLPTLSSRTSSMPAVNIKENEKNFTLELAVPGIDKKDLKIDINEDVLTISSETKSETEENTDGYKRKEFSYSSFCRSFDSLLTNAIRRSLSPLILIPFPVINLSRSERKSSFADTSLMSGFHPAAINSSLQLNSSEATPYSSALKESEMKLSGLDSITALAAL